MDPMDALFPLDPHIFIFPATYIIYQWKRFEPLISYTNMAIVHTQSSV